MNHSRIPDKMFCFPKVVRRKRVSLTSSCSYFVDCAKLSLSLTSLFVELTVFKFRISNVLTKIQGA